MYSGPRGDEQLPAQTHMYTPGRGFGRDLLKTLPNSEQVEWFKEVINLLWESFITRLTN